MAKNLESKLKRKFETIHDRKVNEREEWEFHKKMQALESKENKENYD